MKSLSKDQRAALFEVYKRPWQDKPLSYLAFRRTAFVGIGMDCILVPWCGMIVGIETDGYTHT
jgi:hypothetical protein